MTEVNVPLSVSIGADVDLSVDSGRRVPMSMDTRITQVASNDYNDLENKPSINEVELTGDKSLEDLGIIIPTVPTDVSAFNNDAEYVNAQEAAAAAPVQSVNGQTGTVTVSVPTDVSELNNDAGYITAAGAPVQSVNGETGTVTIEVPTKVSELVNDTGYITDPGVSSFNGYIGAVTYTAPVQSVNGQTGTVNIAIPTVPTNVSSFNNDAGYLTLATLPIYDGGVSE